MQRFWPLAKPALLTATAVFLLAANLLTFNSFPVVKATYDQPSDFHCPTGGTKYEGSTGSQTLNGVTVIWSGHQVTVSGGSAQICVKAALKNSGKDWVSGSWKVYWKNSGGQTPDISYLVIYSARPDTSPTPSLTPTPKPGCHRKPDCHPTPTPTKKPCPTKTPTPTPEVTPTPSPEATPTPTPDPEITPTPQPEMTPTPTDVPAPQPCNGCGGWPSAPSCGATVPPAPVLLSVAKHGATATVTWTAVTPVTHYTLSYGIKPDEFIYGVPNTGNVTSFTVGSLDPNTQYYFSVRAVNDCAPSDPSGGIGGGFVLGASTLAATGNAALIYLSLSAGTIFSILAFAFFRLGKHVA